MESHMHYATSYVQITATYLVSYTISKIYGQLMVQFLLLTGGASLMH